jgi:hypothetical protein
MHGFPSFEWPTVQIWIFRINANKQTKSTRYWKHSYNCPQMVHVGLHSVGTNHKKFGGQKIQMYFAECQLVDTRQSMLCRVPVGWHSAKKCKLIFAECHLGDTRQRLLCRVSSIWHSAKRNLKIKKSLPSARSRALGKARVYSNCQAFLSHPITLFSLSTPRRVVATSPSNAGRPVLHRCPPRAVPRPRP